MSVPSIIILGYKRSGTSLLRVILNSHPDIAIGPEIKFMQKIVKNFPATPEEFAEVTKKEAADFNFADEDVLDVYNNSKTADEIMFNWCNTYKEKSGKKIWGDKTPQNFKYLKMIAVKFSGSLFIHIVRHPYEAMRSAKRRNQYNGVHTICGWLFSNINVRHVNKKKYMFFRYEDFVKSPGYYVDAIQEQAGVVKTDILSSYTARDHGRIASGDSWNKPIASEKKNEPEVLSAIDKFLIKVICFRYLKKYGYI